VSGLKGGDRENLVDLLPLDFVKVAQAKICAGPGLVLVQRLPTFIERSEAGDAHAGQPQRFAH
jgi:hypothetical protein